MKLIIPSMITLKNSRIHHKGIFAKVNIPKNTKIIEYLGEKITKKEGDRRSEKSFKLSKKNPDYGAVYIFELDKKSDIDGNVNYNLARFINHSCSPNCRFRISKGHIWIISKRKIKKGEELSYNYGYDFEDYNNHPCRCGSKNCIGYILAEEHWHKLKK